MSINYMIKKQIFERILEIFIQNKTKGNLLHSCILNLFEMLTPAEVQQQAANSGMMLSGVMGMNDYNSAGAPKTEGGYVQFNLLTKLY